MGGRAWFSRVGEVVVESRRVLPLSFLEVLWGERGWIAAGLFFISLLSAFAGSMN